MLARQNDKHQQRVAATCVLLFTASARRRSSIIVAMELYLPVRRATHTGSYDMPSIRDKRAMA